MRCTHQAMLSTQETTEVPLSLHARDAIPRRFANKRSTVEAAVFSTVLLLLSVLLSCTPRISDAGDATSDKRSNSLRRHFQLYSRVGYYDSAIYDRTGVIKKVDLAAYGLPRIPLVFANAIWPSGSPTSEYDGAYFRTFLVGKHLQDPVVCLDIEALPIKGNDPTSQTNLETLRSILRDARRALPTARLGYYAIVPDSGVYWSLAKERPEGIARWHAINRLTLPLALEVDIVFPSLYTYSDNRSEWLRAAEYKLVQAKSYGKPVIAFIMPQYHAAARNQEALSFIDPGFWRLQLETVYKHADGAVIFGLGKPWDAHAPWWAETLRFVREIEALQPTRPPRSQRTPRRSARP